MKIKLRISQAASYAIHRNRISETFDRFIMADKMFKGTRYWEKRAEYIDNVDQSLRDYITNVIHRASMV